METVTEQIEEEATTQNEVIATETETGTKTELPDDDGRIVKLISQDARVGHFIVDVLAGIDPQEAATLHFPSEKAEEQSQPNLEAITAEAEQRGYLRGKNEKIALEMKRPAQWNGEIPPDDAPQEQPPILNNMRKSVWD